LDSGADTLCPNPKYVVSKNNNVTNNFFIIQLLDLLCCH
jgi:hypothetical protein